MLIYEKNLGKSDITNEWVECIISYWWDKLKICSVGLRMLGDKRQPIFLIPIIKKR